MPLRVAAAACTLGAWTLVPLGSLGAGAAARCLLCARAACALCAWELGSGGAGCGAWKLGWSLAEQRGVRYSTEHLVTRQLTRQEQVADFATLVLFPR